MAGNNFVRWSLSASILAASSAGAFAHHPMGGTTPVTFLQGFLSGLGHPVLGLDHFAFIVGIGLLAGLTGLGLALPILFVTAMTAGLALHVAGIDIPYVELLVALSVVAIGVAVAGRLEARARIAATAFAVAGVFHGFALGETAIGAEATPLAAYIFGLCVIQMTVAALAWRLAGGQSDASAESSVAVLAVHRSVHTYVRIAGIAIAVVGIGHAWLASGVTT